MVRSADHNAFLKHFNNGNAVPVYVPRQLYNNGIGVPTRSLPVAPGTNLKVGGGGTDPVVVPLHFFCSKSTIGRFL